MKRRRAYENEEMWIPVAPLVTMVEQMPDDPGENWKAKIFSYLKRVEQEPAALTFHSEWEKLSVLDERMDDTERTLFPDETYRCKRCGGKSYFGVSCRRDRYCQMCGSRMENAGSRPIHAEGYEIKNKAGTGKRGGSKAE